MRRGTSYPTEPTIPTYPAISSAGFDPDAQSFLTRANITDPTQQAAVNQLALSLKSAGIWSKMVALYPFVGGSASSHAQNLVSSSFTVTWSGTITHDSNGVKGNGTTGFGDTGLIPSVAGLQLNSTHASAYINLAETVLGAQSGGTDGLAQSFQLAINLGPGTAFWDCYGTTTGRVTGAASGTTGFYLGSRNASNSNAIYRNGASFLSNATASETLNSTLSVYLLARNLSGSATLFSDGRQALNSLGLGLSAAEVTSFNTAVQAFETTLGRA